MSKVRGGVIVAGLAAGLMVSSANAEELYGTLKKIDQENTITIGHRESSAPFSYLNGEKKPVGYAVEICQKIAEEVAKTLNKPDLQIKMVPVNAQNRISMVTDGSVDLECGSTTNTLTRQRQVDFSAIYFTTGTRVLTRKAANATEIEDLKGKTIALVGGSTNEKAVKALIDGGKLKDARAVTVKDYDDGLHAVESGRADAFATDDIILYGLLAKSQMKGDLEVVGRFLTYDPYGIMVRRDDSAFRLVVNRTLARLYATGEIERLFEKWFGPIGVPVSPLMKVGFELQALPE